MTKQAPKHERFLDAVSSYGRGVSTSSSIPLYYQLYMILQRGIRDRSLEPGSRFPSEDAIATHFQISRPTEPPRVFRRVLYVSPATMTGAS